MIYAARGSSGNMRLKNNNIPSSDELSERKVKASSVRLALAGFDETKPTNNSQHLDYLSSSRSNGSSVLFTVPPKQCQMPDIASTDSAQGQAPGVTTSSEEASKETPVVLNVGSADEQSLDGPSGTKWTSAIAEEVKASFPSTTPGSFGVPTGADIEATFSKSNEISMSIEAGDAVDVVYQC